MATKALPAAKISTSKFLPSSKKKVSSAAIVKSSDKGSGLVVVEKKVIAVENLIKTNLRIENDAAKKKRIRDERKKDEVQEDALESEPKGKEEKAGKKISLPRLSFLETIKQFLFKVLLGFIAIKLLPHLPKLLAFLPTLMEAAETIIDWAGKFLNAGASFLAGAYEVRDKTEGIIRSVGGENFVKVFNVFEKHLDTAIFAAIALASASGGDGGLLDVGMEMGADWIKKRLFQQGVQSAASTATQLSIPGLGGAGAGAGGTTAASTAGTATGMGAAATAAVVAGAGLLASALGEGAFQLRKMAKGPIEETQKKFDKANWFDPRSEERRVGKECRSRWSPYH